MPWMALVGLVVAMALARCCAIRADARWATRPRRAAQFLARVTGGAAAAVAGASVARGMADARGEHEIVDVEVKLAEAAEARSTGSRSSSSPISTPA